jgi:hypothetical protein
MAKNKVSEWSATPANNTDIGGIDIAEGCAPSGINNAIRELMAQVKDMQAGTDSDNFTVGGNLTVNGTTTLTGKTTTDVVGDVYASNGTSKILDNGTDGTNATFTGSVTGNVTGNVTGTATTATNIAGGGAGRVPYNTASGTTSFTSAGTSGQYLKSNGTSAPTWADPSTLTEATAQSPTGTNVVNFTGIPSWVKRITVSLYRVSGNAGGFIYIQVGTGGTYETTGYFTYNSNLTSSGTSLASNTEAICLISTSDASSVVSGLFTLTKVGGNNWVGTGSIMRSGDSTSSYTQGSISLGGALDSLRLLRASGNYDSGTINIMYE